jgi:Stage II sporulation protein E (SpoIIE)
VVCRLPPAWAQLRSALRAFALADADPATVLTGLDRLVEHGGQAEMATVAYAVLNPSDGTVVMGDAGHPPLVHLPMDGPSNSSTQAPERHRSSAGTTVQPACSAPPGRGRPRLHRRSVEARDRSLEDGTALLVSCVEGVRDRPLYVILDAVVATMVNPAGADDWTVLGLRWMGS